VNPSLLALAFTLGALLGLGTALAMAMRTLRLLTRALESSMDMWAIPEDQP
jgi:hypothetical protein